MATQHCYNDSSSNHQVKMAEKLITYFTTAGFSQTESEQIASHFQIRQFSKDDHFVKEGKISKELAFVETGQFRYYSISNLGDEHTTYISLENSFAASLLSYLNEVPARENIVALSNATVWVIAKKDVILLQNQIALFREWYIKLLEWQICCIDKSRLNLITMTAEERYLQLMQEEPELLQKVPLQYIASILSITPRHLSRLRKNI